MANFKIVAGPLSEKELVGQKKIKLFEILIFRDRQTINKLRVSLKGKCFGGSKDVKQVRLTDFLIIHELVVFKSSERVQGSDDHAVQILRNFVVFEGQIALLEDHHTELVVGDSTVLDCDHSLHDPKRCALTRVDLTVFELNVLAVRDGDGARIDFFGGNVVKDAVHDGHWLELVFDF